jgi:excisionase family DNA binding protein
VINIDPTTPPDTPALLTLAEVAERLRITERLAYQLTYQRRLPSVKVGRYVRVPASALAEFVNAQTRQVRK